jgi:probable phosphoglycerate mutase
MEPIADLAEWDYGAYEGRTTDQIRESRPGWSLWRDGVPSGEGIDDVARRADMVISYATASKGSVVIFAHAHILRVLAVRWISLAPHNGRSLALGPASTSILGHEHETTTILSWNDRSYL